MLLNCILEKNKSKNHHNLQFTLAKVDNFHFLMRNSVLFSCFSLHFLKSQNEHIHVVIVTFIYFYFQYFYPKKKLPISNKTPFHICPRCPSQQGVYIIHIAKIVKLSLQHSHFYPFLTIFNLKFHILTSLGFATILGWHETCQDRAWV